MMRLLLSLLAVVPLVAHATCAAAAGLNQKLTKPYAEMTSGELLDVHFGDLFRGQGYKKSYALVIGISQYDEYQDLDTQNDPVLVAEHLMDVQGFDEVTIITEEFVTLDRIRELMEDEYPAVLDANDRFLFYWSGHGETRETRSGDKGYLVLHDSGHNRYSDMLNMDDVRRWNDVLPARQVLFVMDSCFSGLVGTVPKSADRARDLKRLLSAPGRHLLTAGTGEQETIVLEGTHTSLFTSAFLAGLSGAADAATTVRPRDGVITLSELHDHVTYQVNRDRIDARWNRNITPQLRAIGDSEGAFFFINPEVVEDVDRRSAVALDRPVTPPAASAKGGDRLAALAVTTGGDGLTPEARIYGTPESGFRDCPTCPEMIWLPPGRFTMGSPVSEPGRSNNEGPLHWVEVAPFAIARTEVTFDQWMACVADGVCGFVPDDNGWGRGARPVINVTFAEAKTYIGWLNSKVAGAEGPYRLPSEAEWEYAARAGVMTPYPWGDTWDAKMANGREGETITPDLVRRAAESPESKAMEGVASLLGDLGAGGFDDPGAAEDLQRRTDQMMVDLMRGLMRGDRVDIEGLLREVGSRETKPVGSFPANAWGLLDMIGNVSEWTEDCWSETYHDAPPDARAATQGGLCRDRQRVVRGGSGLETPPQLRSAQRFAMAESFAIPWLGFRPARSLDASVTAE